MEYSLLFFFTDKIKINAQQRLCVLAIAAFGHSINEIFHTFDPEYMASFRICMPNAHKKVQLISLNYSAGHMT